MKHKNQFYKNNNAVWLNLVWYALIGSLLTLLAIPTNTASNKNDIDANSVITIEVITPETTLSELSTINWYFSEPVRVEPVFITSSHIKAPARLSHHDPKTDTSARLERFYNIKIKNNTIDDAALNLALNHLENDSRVMSVTTKESYQTADNKEDNPKFYWYLMAEPQANNHVSGLNAHYAWQRGFTGKGVKVIDVEFSHAADENADLPELFYDQNCKQVNQANCKNPKHGTAVLGVLAAKQNGNNTVGIAPDAAIGFQSVRFEKQSNFGNTPEAIRRAANQLAAGDILLTEVVSERPKRLLESDPAICAALEYASSKGVIIVEAAGNEGTNIDEAATCPNANAIIVGADQIGVASKKKDTQAKRGYAAKFSNYGERVDLYAMGGEIWTTFPAGRSGHFGGTSAASALMAGVIALVQNAANELIGRPLNASEIKALLKSTGTRYRGDKPIGYWPNIKAAIDKLEAMPRVSAQ